MIKRILLGAGIVFSTIGVKAQQAVHQCGTDQYHKEMMAQNPELKAQETAFRAYWEQFKQSDTYKRAITPTAKKASAPKYIIPVVVHVFASSKNAQNNISDAQIQSEIDFLNKSFRNLNADSVNRRTGVMNGVPYDYKAIAGDAEIEFRLARKDPNGNCTNGIVRVASSFDDKGNDNLKKTSVWDTKRYFNMWVVRSIDRGPGVAVAGYAQFPFFAGGSWSNLTDGVMVIHNEFGNIGTSQPGQTPNVTTTTHEAGHWLGLYHPFQDSDSCGVINDGVDDTPPTYFVASTTEPLRNRCNITNYNSCATDKLNGINNDRPDMMENFMDYFIGSCASNMFTLQQIARMHYCIETYRSKLVSTENLEFTGVLNTATPCAPVPAFNIAISGNPTFERQACVGTAFSFTDLSYNGTPTSYAWDFGDGATPQTSTVANPTNVVYATPGYKTITLTVSNANGSNTKTFTNFVLINQASALNYQAFRPDYPVAADGWDLRGDDIGNTWTLSDIGVYNGYKSLRLSGSNSGMYGKEYAVITPGFDFTGASAPYFKFMYAFAQNVSGTTNTNDALSVQYSINCGLTWNNLRAPVSGASLATISTPLASSVDFVPVNVSQWKEVSVLSSSIPKVSNVRFRILFESQSGNNLYLDDFQFGLKSGLNELTSSDINLNVYPNPFSASTKITYSLPAAAQTTIEVYDIVGKKVADLFNGKQTEGAQEVVFDRSAHGLNNGLYFVKIKVEGSVITQKVMVN